jgi:hypothetical protein
VCWTQPGCQSARFCWLAHGKHTPTEILAVIAATLLPTLGSHCCNAALCECLTGSDRCGGTQL